MKNTKITTILLGVIVLTACVSGWVPGEKLGLKNLQELAQSFFTQEGDEKYNPEVDFNNDKEIDVVDLQILAQNYDYNP